MVRGAFRLRSLLRLGCPHAGIQQPAQGIGDSTAPSGQTAGVRAGSARLAVKTAPLLTHRGATAIFPPMHSKIAHLPGRPRSLPFAGTRHHMDTCTSHSTQGKPAPNYSDDALNAADKVDGAKRRRTFDTLIGRHSICYKMFMHALQGLYPAIRGLSAVAMMLTQDHAAAEVECEDSVMRGVCGLCSGRCRGEVHTGACCHAGRLRAALVSWILT